jgi:hypothetical protein
VAKKPLWRARRNRRNDVHVVPVNDLRKHVDLRRCWCEPRITQEKATGAVVVHNSKDGRELIERHGLQ